MRPGDDFTCPICFITQSYTEKTSLPCRCYACTDCLSEWLILKITENQYTLASQVPCFMARCKKGPSPLRTIYEKIPPSCQPKLNDSLLQVYLTQEQDIRKCPNTNCQYAGVISLDSSCNSSLQCDLCGTAWRDKQHYTKSERFFAWLRNEPARTEEESSQRWIRSKAKRCPECRVNIQKNGGCDHMTCTKCKCEFCWVCSKVYPAHDWKMHRNIRNVFFSSVVTVILWILGILAVYLGCKYVFFPLLGAIANGVFRFLYSSLMLTILDILAANAFTGLLIATFSTFNTPMHTRVSCFVLMAISFAVSYYFDYFAVMVNIMKIEMVILPIGMALFILFRGCFKPVPIEINKTRYQLVHPTRITKPKIVEKLPKSSQNQKVFQKSFVKTSRR